MEDLQWIIRFVQKLYKIHIKTKSKDRLEYFNKFALFTEIFFKIMSTLYLLSVFTFFPYPAYMYFFKHEVVTMIPLYAPFIDESQPAGYIALGALHIMLFFFATLGILACDFFMAIIIISTLIFAKLISLELEQIDIDQPLKNSELLVRGRFRNVLIMHQEMIR